MKTAYELAMERMEKDSGAAKKLTDEQREQIAEIEKKYEAKIAETKLSFDARIADAANFEELQAAQAELAQTVAALNEKCDGEKEAVWDEA